MAIVEVDRISKTFGKLNVLKDFSLKIDKGEFFGLLGPNGAGKTTLINILAGLIHADSGSVRINGFDTILNFKSARKSVGIVPQELIYDPFFSVREALQLQSGYFGIRNNQKWIDELLENLGLIEKANVNSRSLSGGMKRRLLIAQALVHRPPVIVLDEPTAGVDVELRQNLWKFIQRLNREGHTIILTTHYLEEAQMLCDKVAMMRSGKVAVLDTMQALLDRFASKQLILYIKPGKLPSGLENKLFSVTDSIPPILGNRDSFFLKNFRNSAVKSNKQAFCFRVKDGREVQKILKDCWEAGCEIEDMELIESDLEDAFIQVTRADVS